MNKVSVYYPYYDVYTDIDDPMEETEALEERRRSVVREASRTMTSRGFIDIPDQDYINPIRGSK